MKCVRSQLQVGQETKAVLNGTARSDLLEALLDDSKSERRLFDNTVFTYNTEDKWKPTRKPTPVNVIPERSGRGRRDAFLAGRRPRSKWVKS
jgi:hypothetical protein